MKPTPPTSIFVIGLLSLVVGTIGVLWDGAGAISLLAGKQLAAEYFTPSQRDAMARREAAMQRQVPGLEAYQIVVMQAVPWLLTLALLVSGVGLLQARPGARKLSIAYAIVSILHKVGMAAYTIAYLLPFYKTPIYLLEMTRPQLTPGAETITNVSAVVTPLVLMAYPVLVLFIMFRPKVAGAFTTQPVPAPSAA